MKVSLSRDWPKLVVLTGFIWISTLTIFNMIHVFYGWFPLPDGTEQKELWKKEEVIDFIGSYASDSRDHIAKQIYPLLLIFFGIVASFYNEPQKTEPAAGGNG